MAMTRPYIPLKGDGVYNPVIQSNPKLDMYVRGRLPDHISAAYRKKQRQPGSVVKQPYIDKIMPAIQGPKATPGVASMMGSGKNKKVVRNPYNQGVASKRLALRNEINISTKKHTIKPIKGTVGKSTKQIAYMPQYKGSKAQVGFSV
jgi:hypothetical protein